jgi:hypothetical protein
VYVCDNPNTGHFVREYNSFYTVCPTVIVISSWQNWFVWIIQSSDVKYKHLTRTTKIAFEKKSTPPISVWIHQIKYIILLLPIVLLLIRSHWNCYGQLLLYTQPIFYLGVMQLNEHREISISNIHQLKQRLGK